MEKSGKPAGCRTPLLLLLFLVCGSENVRAQNLQLHYDMGRGRGYLTSTLEAFHPDRYGSTFFFVDLDYHSVPEVSGVTMAYLEIARALKPKDFPVAFHTEYNGGLGFFSDNGEPGAFPIESAILNGIEFSADAEDFSRGFTLQLLHKYIRDKHNFSFQITGVWYLLLCGGKLSFTGFADFWREDLYFSTGVTRFCFNAEPQLWYNFNPHFSAGGEAEVDVNFGGRKGLNLYPTLGVKYTF